MHGVPRRKGVTQVVEAEIMNLRPVEQAPKLPPLSQAVKDPYFGKAARADTCSILIDWWLGMHQGLP
jgi:hypothetical protein